MPNPEFLREGSAIEDFMRLNQDVIGKGSEQTASTANDIFRSFFMIETPLLITNLETTRLIKYTSNVSQPTNPLNEVANLCLKAGAVVHHLARAMELERPIGLKFLHPVRVAIHTRSGLEQEVKRELGIKEIENFLPLNEKKDLFMRMTLPKLGMTFPFRGSCACLNGKKCHDVSISN